MRTGCVGSSIGIEGCLQWIDFCLLFTHLSPEEDLLPFRKWVRWWAHLSLSLSLSSLDRVGLSMGRNRRRRRVDQNKYSDRKLPRMNGIPAL